MKQLKFMLAAATAVGLATAAQAATDDMTLVNEGFDNYTTEQVVTEIDGFSFNGVEGDNESAIIKEAEGDMALKVNTGTDPLLRALDYNNNTGAQDLDLADENAAINYVNIDTVVQFTVTPVGDPVDAKAGDKLMIFLQEVAAAEEGGESTTELKVKALQYKAAFEGWNEESESLEKVPATMITNDWNVVYTDGTAVAVEANKPYGLSVKTELVDGVPMFKISLDGKEIKPVENLHLAAANSSYFPSLLGPAETTLTHVGFAGEGTVDDLVVTKNYNVPDSTDFTFVVKWDTGISAVAYTIGGVDQGSVPSDGFKVPEGETVELVVTLADTEWTKLAEGTVLKYENVAADNKGIELTTVKITSKPSTDGGVVLNPNATVPEIQASAEIKNGYFAGEGVTKDELTTVLNWKAKKGADYNIDNISFGVAPDKETDDTKAYLLNCSKEELADEVANFKFPAIVPGVKPSVNAPLHGGKYNGTLNIYGADTVGGLADEVDATADHKFFKAVLTK